ncbi:helix-turn-helix domain-containing protein [Cryobacterium sp. Y62]|uniref:helix-turn-helix domain-containing protein n=1 Tax=Cryobacterium sp. Y62 TaxID=2048284 RepID=UPI0034CFD224
MLGTRPAALPDPEPHCEWLTTTQAANRLGMTDRGIRKAIATGRLQAESVDGHWRISREQLQHFRATRPRAA